MIFNLVLFLVLVILFIFLSFVWPPDSPWSPWWRTNRKTARIMCKLSKINKNDIVYDLGCGDGTMLSVAASEFGAKGVGIEIDPLRFIIATLMIRIIRVNDKVVITRKNFFDVDLSKATVVIVYLVPKALARLLPKLKKELKPETRLVSYRYEIDLPLILHDKVNNIRIYRINNI